MKLVNVKYLLSSMVFFFFFVGYEDLFPFSAAFTIIYHRVAVGKLLQALRETSLTGLNNSL